MTPLQLRSVASSDSAVDRVTAEVRRAVLSGALPPGRTFSIAELSSQLGVSHIPVREALRRLDAQGLIVQRPGRRAMVSPLNREELRAIFRLRQQIEPDLAARSVSLLSKAELDRAADLLAAYLSGSDDIDQLWNFHHDLHMTLMRPGGVRVGPADPRAAVACQRPLYPCRLRPVCAQRPRSAGPRSGPRDPAGCGPVRIACRDPARGQ